MLEPLRIFEARCSDTVTLKQLIQIAQNRDRWPESRRVFSEIRDKTLAAERASDELAITQYSFEEICAKTLYNLTYESAPYDADSAFWVLPLAVELGRRLDIPPGNVSSLLRR